MKYSVYNSIYTVIMQLRSYSILKINRKSKRQKSQY